MHRRQDSENLEDWMRSVEDRITELGQDTTSRVLPPNWVFYESGGSLFVKNLTTANTVQIEP